MFGRKLAMHVLTTSLHFWEFLGISKKMCLKGASCISWNAAKCPAACGLGAKLLIHKLSLKVNKTMKLHFLDIPRMI